METQSRAEPLSYKRPFYEHEGYCPICEQPRRFVATHSWLRDSYQCLACRSIPRERAFIHVLNTFYPYWRSLEIHESSPTFAAQRKLSRECRRYTISHFLPDVPPGQSRRGVRSENLEHLTFADASFDLFVTQDVFEHIFDYRRAFREVMRVLKPGGAHVFTTPRYRGQANTEDRARWENGDVVHLAEPPEFHGNPVDKNGSLVTVHYGDDLCDLIYAETGCPTTAYPIDDAGIGAVAEFLDVFITVKRPADIDTWAGWEKFVSLPPALIPPQLARRSPVDHVRAWLRLRY